MLTVEFSRELALSMLQSSEEFPVDFDQGWRWIGYSTKQKARNKLFNNFELETDYIVLLNQMGKQTRRGGHNREEIRLTVDCFKSLGMMAGTEKGKEIRRYFLKCERIAKQAVESISAQSPETERVKLELELAKVKQRYQETGRAIAASTSPAMLAFIRGEAPLPPKIEHRDRFVDPITGKEVSSAEGRSLTQLIVDAGLNPKSTRDRAKVKNILKTYGFDYDSLKGWATASYLREYPVLPDEVYDQALRAVVAELTMDEQPNLFVNQFQPKSLPSSTFIAWAKDEYEERDRVPRWHKNPHSIVFGKDLRGLSL